MRISKLLFLTVFVTALLVGVAPTYAHTGHGHDTDLAFASVFHHYRAVWKVLTADGLDGVTAHAEGMREAADAIAAELSAERAGLVSDADTAAAEGFFDAVARAAIDLGAAGDLATAREAFYAASKPMVRLSELLEGERPKVIYCPMAKKSWLQIEDEVANPYYGRMMPKCGDVVGE